MADRRYRRHAAQAPFEGTRPRGAHARRSARNRSGPSARRTPRRGGGRATYCLGRRNLAPARTQGGRVTTRSAARWRATAPTCPFTPHAVPARARRARRASAAWWQAPRRGTRNRGRGRIRPTLGRSLAPPLAGRPPAPLFRGRPVAKTTWRAAAGPAPGHRARRGGADPGLFAKTRYSQSSQPQVRAGDGVLSKIAERLRALAST